MIMMNDDDRGDSAFGRGGWFWEGLQDAGRELGILAQGIAQGLGVLLAVLMLIGAVVIGFHVVPAWLAHDNPPLACQLAGGHWDLWNGWTCGTAP